MTQVYVLLPWSGYQALDEHSRATILSYDPPARSTHPQDHVVGPLAPEDARRVKDAFDTLCIEDWTPNQSRKDREDGFERRAEAKRVLDIYDA